MRPSKLFAFLLMFAIISCNKEPENGTEPLDPAPVPEGYTLADDAQLLSDSFASTVIAIDEEEKWFRTDGNQRPSVGTILIYP